MTRPPIARTVVPANLDLQTKAIGVFVLLVSPMKSVKLVRHQDSQSLLFFHVFLMVFIVTSPTIINGKCFCMTRRGYFPFGFNPF